MFRRRQSHNINTSVMFGGRTADFLNAPTHRYDLVVKRNADISGNVDIGGNLTVHGDINAVNFRATGNYYLDNYVLIPAGTIIMSGINASGSINIPAGWLNCNGASYSRTVYADLFVAIGVAFGSADITSFYVPNMQGNVAIGQKPVDYPIVGSVGGEKTHTLTTEEIPSHSHTLTRKSNLDSGAFDTSDAHQDESSACTTDRGDLGPFNTNATGGSIAHNNMQPYIVLTYLIKY